MKNRTSLLLLACVLLLSFHQSARAITIASTVLETNTQATTGATAPTPVSSTPFDFTLTNYLSLVSIDSILFRLTIEDGNTGSGEFDENQWTLALDGINTGIVLNGFTAVENSVNLDVTLDFSGSITNAAAILAALKTDGKLQATIVDATGTNVGVIVNGNEIYVGNITNDAMTTLEITGAIPEPSTYALLVFGAIALAGGRIVRRARS